MISLTNHYSQWGGSELVIIYPMPLDRPARDLHGSPLQCWPAVTDIEQINRTWLYIDNDEYVYIYMYNIIIIYPNKYYIYIYTIHMRRYNSIIISHQFVFCLNNYTHTVYIYLDQYSILTLECVELATLEVTLIMRAKKSFVLCWGLCTVSVISWSVYSGVSLS